MLSYAPFSTPLADNKRFIKRVGSRAAVVALSRGGGWWLLVLCCTIPPPCLLLGSPELGSHFGAGEGWWSCPEQQQGWRCLWEPLLALTLELQCSPASSQRGAVENEGKSQMAGEKKPQIPGQAAVSSQSATGQQGLRDSLGGVMGWGPNPALAHSALLSPALGLQQVAVRKFKGLKLSLF